MVLMHMHSQESLYARPTLPINVAKFCLSSTHLKYAKTALKPTLQKKMEGGRLGRGWFAFHTGNHENHEMKFWKTTPFHSRKLQIPIFFRSRGYHDNHCKFQYFISRKPLGCTPKGSYGNTRF